MKEKLCLLFLLAIFFVHCSTQTTKPNTQPLPQVEEWINTGEGLIQKGMASWYGDDFHGKRTANGEIYDMNKLTAAHKFLRFHTLVEVKNLENNKIVIVRINDRGPFVKGRIIDLSRKAAQKIGMKDIGTAQVRLKIVKPNHLAHTQSEDTKKTPKNINKIIKPDEITVTEVKEVEQPPNNEISPPENFSSPINHNGGYYLQAGAFGSLKNAKRLTRQIQQLVPEINFSVKSIEGLYKIISEKINSRPNAMQYKKRLEDNGIEVFIRDQ